jgi:hypothetical protein
LKSVFDGIWTWRGPIILIASSVSAVVAYLSIWGLADELDVAVADFSFDRSAYVLFVGAYIALGLLWMSLIAVVAAITFVALDDLDSRRVTGAALAVFAALAAVLWVLTRGSDGWLGLVLSVLLVAATGGFVGSYAAWPGEDAQFLRWGAAASILVVAAVFVVAALASFSSEGRDVAEYARDLARGEDVAEPSSLLGLSVAPSRGWLAIGGDRLCVVRVSERVHLLVPVSDDDPIETLIASGDSFLSDPAC